MNNNYGGRMKKYIKLILGIGIFISIFLGIIYCVVYNKNINEVNDDNFNHNKIIQYVLECNIRDFSGEEKDEIKRKVNKTINDSKDKKTLSECYYILGFLNSLEKNNKEAIRLYNKAIANIDSIKDIKIKTQIYYELSRMYLYENEYDKSSESFEKIKEIAFKYNKKEEAVKYGVKRGYDIYCIPDGSNESVQILTEALELAKEINYEEIEEVYFYLGRSYWSNDKFIESINAKLEALNIVDSKNLEEKIALISTDLGIDYLYSGNYEEALVYLSRVLSSNLEDEYEDAKIKSYSLMNICEAYIKLEEFDKAKDSFEKLEEEILKQKNGAYKEDCITYIYGNKADLQIQLGNINEAIKLLDTAKKRYEKSDKFSFYDFDVKLLEEYGDAYYELGNYSLALKYHKEAEDIVKTRGLTYLEEDYNNKIYLDYKGLGDYENTIKYLEKNNELKSNLFDDKDKEYSQYIHNQFENKKNLEKISELEQIGKRYKIFFTILGLGAIIISFFSFHIYKKNKEINRLNKLFKNLSVTDPLTNTANRRALDEFLAGNWALYKETRMPISFMMIDIDFFKLYNDNYGHLKGDEVLKLVASSINVSCENGDFVARYGGEEFIVIMLNTDKKEATKNANNIMQNIYHLNIKHEFSPVSDRLTLSMGITTAHIGTTKDYEYYIKKADEALYKAKQYGRNEYIFIE